jgi:hypothetical protein
MAIENRMNEQLWVGFNLFVLAVLALDVGVFHRLFEQQIDELKRHALRLHQRAASDA